MAALGQTPLFAIRQGDDLLDQALQSRGYRVVDPVVAYAADCAHLADPPPSPMSAFAHWPPLAICADLWAEGGIGPERLAIMHRVEGAKCAILARMNDQPTGVAFVAINGTTAMLHALEVRVRARRQGSAHNILRAAAGWAQQNGANRLALVVTVANTAARGLYASMGMEVVGQYHYRQR
jgi:GNAT superfamily N-acetyltransferase